jgi:hypothetical protein
MKKYKTSLLVFFFISFLQSYSQKSLQIITEHFGKVKRYEVFKNELLDYKLKGDFFYRRNKIVNLADSVIVLSNDSLVRLKDIKAVRIQRGGHLAKTFREFFLFAGIGFLSLNTANNAINGTEPLVDKRAVYISGALIGTSVLLKMLCTKHLRLNRHTVFKINSVDYSKLNEK